MSVYREPEPSPRCVVCKTLPRSTGDEYEAFETCSSQECRITRAKEILDERKRAEALRSMGLTLLRGALRRG